MKKNLFLLILVLCMSIPYFIHAQENLILNGDFEEDDGNGKPAFWTTDAWHVDDGSTNFYIGSDKPKSGKRYVGIDNVKSNDARFIQSIRVLPDSVYKLSCWVRVNAPNVLADKVYATIGIYTSQVCCYSKQLTNTTGNWENIEYFVKTASTQTEMTVHVRIGHFSSDVVGKAEFDDFKVVLVSDPGTATIENLSEVVAAEEVKGSNSQYVIIIVIVSAIILVIIAIFMILFFLKKTPAVEMADDETTEENPQGESVEKKTDQPDKVE